MPNDSESTNEVESPTGLIVDWGGVLTTNVFESFASFCTAEGLPEDLVVTAFRTDPVAYDLLARLELGAMSEDEFAEGFALLIGVEPEGLIERMMAGSGPDTAMINAVRRARHHGIVTGLISNSWGASRYDQDALRELFDGVVISGSVGVRKPAPEIYEMGAQAVRLPPEELVYVDDLRGNLKPARALGMRTIHHQDSATTIAELSRLFGVDLGQDSGE